MFDILGQVESLKNIFVGFSYHNNWTQMCHSCMCGLLSSVHVHVSVNEIVSFTTAQEPPLALEAESGTELK